MKNTFQLSFTVGIKIRNILNVQSFNNMEDLGKSKLNVKPC